MYQICPRCLRKVYSAEEKRAYGKAWHLFCFSCRFCKRLLEDENDAMRDNNGDIYCSDCFARRDELELASSIEETENEAEGNQMIMCSHPPAAVTIGLPSAVTTFYARFNRRRSASKGTEGADGGRGYFGKPFPLYPDNDGTQGSDGTPPKCVRCGNKVFHAEARQVDGRLYHDCCFACLCCHKTLDATSVNVCRGDIYCKTCFLRIAGPDGYGFGLGPGTLQSF